MIVFVQAPSGAGKSTWIKDVHDCCDFMRHDGDELPEISEVYQRMRHRFGKDWWHVRGHSDYKRPLMRTAFRRIYESMFLDDKRHLVFTGERLCEWESIVVVPRLTTLIHHHASRAIAGTHPVVLDRAELVDLIDAFVKIADRDLRPRFRNFAEAERCALRYFKGVERARGIEPSPTPPEGNSGALETSGPREQ